MATRTLLDIVQDILNSLDSDEVNSINDTLESLQIAQIVKTTYYNIIDGKDWPQLYQLYQLTGLGNTNKPTHMAIPSDVVDVDWVRYNVRTSTDTKDRFTKIDYISPEEFIDLVNARDSSATNVQQVTDVVTLNIIDDKAPQYWTSFDNDYIVFDSFDSDVDTTLQESKTQCYGKRHPTFSLTDAFVPDLPVQAFSYLLAEAKSTAFIELRQSPNSKAEQHSISQRRKMSQESWKAGGGVKYPNFGRKK